MKLIITATTREASLSLQVAKIVQNIYKTLDEQVEILDLKEVPFSKIVQKAYQKESLSDIQVYLDQIAQAEALIIICPEYNGGIPGLIKHFIDHWIYPDSFVFKPVCLIGLGGRFGALRPLEHLQNIFLYRHSFVFPIRVFLQNIQNLLKNGKITEESVQKNLFDQACYFQKFVKALQTSSLNFKTLI
ncbi:MAG: NADPH-dependent FMN reductase [Bdellovibrionales bacterium]